MPHQNVCLYQQVKTLILFNVHVSYRDLDILKLFSYTDVLTLPLMHNYITFYVSGIMMILIRCDIVLLLFLYVYTAEFPVLIFIICSWQYEY